MGILSLLFLCQCSETTTFSEAGHKTGKLSKDLAIQEESEQIAVPKAKAETPTEHFLKLVPSKFSATAGGELVSFKVETRGELQADDIHYKLEGSGPDLGSISNTGLYTPPETLAIPADVRVVAYLANDASLTSQSEGVVNPEGVVFTQCVNGDQNYPLHAELFFLSPDTYKLPNFTELKKSGDLCMEQISVSDREFDQGFPGISGQFEWFALNIRSVLYAPVTGTYYFGLNSDDGSKLYLNGMEAIDNDGHHGAEEKGNYLQLTQGFHTLRVEYYQGPRYNIALELFWRLPGSDSKEIIPKENFYHPVLLKETISRHSTPIRVKQDNL